MQKLKANPQQSYIREKEVYNKDPYRVYKFYCLSLGKQMRDFFLNCERRGYVK